MIFGSWLRARLRHRGWSATDLEDRLTVSKNDVLHWLAGRDVPNVQTLTRLAEMLGVPDALPGVLPDLLSQALCVGSLARTGDHIGHVMAVEEKWVHLSCFAYPGHTYVIQVPPSDARTVTLAPQTRAFLRRDGGWQAGRIIEREGASYLVALPDGQATRAEESNVFVQAEAAQANPAYLLGARCHDTAFFAEARLPLVRAFTQQRHAAAPLLGLFAAAVDLLPHQAEIVRRILADPNPRYLLADEVGLGKTIEACAVARQWLLDSPDAQVAVLVPPTLVAQWQREWALRFSFPGASARITITSFERAQQTEADLLLIDEAHHLVRPERADLYHHLAVLCHQAQGVLLLSATPASLDPVGLHRLLHLLDPSSYRVGEEAGTLKRRAQQHVLGRHLPTLLDAEAPDFLVEEALDGIQRGVDLDEDVLALAERVRAGLANGSFSEVQLAFADTLQERYRLFHRLLRFRRREVEGAALVGRAQGELRAETEEDPRTVEVLGALDAWRMLLAAEAPVPAYRDLYVAFAWLAETNLAKLVVSVQERLAVPDPPLLAGETEALVALREAAQLPASHATFDRLMLLEACVTECLDRGIPTVVFSDDQDTLAYLGRALATLPGTVVFWVAGARQDNLVPFGSGERDVVLADSSAEEGLNLQRAGALVLASLPQNLNQLEQRLGRLDRLGRRFPFDTFVALPDASDEQSPLRAWHRVVADGLEGYTRSMSDLQFFIADETPALLDVLFEQGPFGLVRSIPDVHARAVQARREIHEQDAFDTLQARFQDSEGLAHALQEAEEHSDNAAKALSEWLSRVWQFGVEPHRGGVRFRYDPRRALLPLDAYLDRFVPYADEAFAVSRSAAQQSDAALLRWGHPLVSQVLSLVELDDRGRAFALRRFAPGLQVITGRQDWLGFTALLLVEADPSPLWSWLQETDSATPGALAALRRRADALFRPLALEMAFDLDGKLVDDPRLQGQLAPPYRAKDPDSGTVNLTKERLGALEDLLPGTDWEQACRQAGLRALDLADKHPTTEEEKRRAVARLDQQTKRLADQNRVLPGHEAVAQSIMHPRIRLDMLGFWHLTTAVPR